MLDDGDRRIYARRSPRLSDGWVLAVFSVPEAERHKRHLLRSRLGRLGFGTAAPGVWIAPARLYEETRHTLRRLATRPVRRPVPAASTSASTATARAVARWWDLDAIAALHEEFLDAHEPVLRAWEERSAVEERDTVSERNTDAYRDYLFALDSWRRLPYADPGLPAELLPEGWPGERSADCLRPVARPGCGTPGWSSYTGPVAAGRSAHRSVRRGFGSSVRPAGGVRLPARYGKGQGAAGPS